MWNMQEVKICRLLIFDLFLEDNPINCYDLFTEGKYSRAVKSKGSRAKMLDLKHSYLN